jgi:hypothetical protein
MQTALLGARERYLRGLGYTRLAALIVAVALGAVLDSPARAATPRYAPPPCPRLSYQSAPALHAQRACMNTGVRSHGTQAGTYLFMTPCNCGAGIYQSDGTLVWWRPGAGVFDETVVEYAGQSYLALYSGGKITLYDKHYHVAGRITPGAGYPNNAVDAHEFQITPDNDALIGIYHNVTLTVNGRTQKVTDYVVRKLSLVRDATGIHTGQVLFEWHAIQHVRLWQSHEPNPGPGATPWDYFHGNAITQDTDGNLLISSRHTWGIYKIDDTPGSPHYGKMIWQVGAKGDHTLGEPWCYQHAIRPLGNNDYSLYDDGGQGPGCINSTQHPARAVIFRVDTSKSPAGVHLVRTYTHSPAIYTDYTGSTQVLSNGNVLVGWANVPEVTEYGAGGQPDLDLSLSDWSYRSLRYAWDGQPTTLPAAVAQHTKSGTWVRASWNGSTEVRAWRVLGGSSASQLAPVTGRIAKGGFETGMFVKNRPKLVAVQALSSSGTVLATSRAVTASG